MNSRECDILNILYEQPYVNQRILSEICGHSLGIVNKSLKNLIRDGYIDENCNVTDKAIKIFKENSPKNAIILAAGAGMRMVPINMETPKAFIEIDGEALIERLIKQLHEAGIVDIYVVVGFMKEQFEYLIDEYGVKLVVNEDYALKNNIHSLNLVTDYISNSYIVPCDVWCDKNPFSSHELYSWYMVSDLVDNDSDVRVNRKMELVSVNETDAGNAMVGICYLLEEQAAIVRGRIREFCKDRRYDNDFWEKALYEKNTMIVQAKVVHSADVAEINTYEQLRELDEHSNQLKSDAIAVISMALGCSNDDVRDITVLKKGMTNRSFLFNCKGKKYIMRIPGEGTDQLIDRRAEAEVYKVLKGKDICDDVAYINPENGYKITEFIENARVCNPLDEDDLKACMTKLKSFHDEGLVVDHEFDIFRQIDFYESLWNGVPSVYRDYTITKKNVLSLKEYIDLHADRKVLTHIDAVPDNFLFAPDNNGGREVRLIDWEYAGMQDPHVDIAMFSIYSFYDRQQVDRLIDIYFDKNCPKETRVKIYCYVAACGLLWSNWCEYKRSLGVEFGEYSLRQYRYAKDFYRIVQEELDGGER